MSKESKQAAMKRFRDNHPDFKAYARAAHAKHSKEHPDKRKASRDKASRTFYKHAGNRLAQNLRCRLRKTLKGISKTSSVLTLVGCSIPELQTHLENLFLPDMTWDNYGEWHVDHIIPCSAFQLEKPAQQHACFHYTNLQPLWGTDNMSKGGVR